MEALNVTTLIEALNLIGEVYRNKDGSQPADAVKKILQQLDGAAGMTLAEWAEAKRSKSKTAPRQLGKSKPERPTLDDALNRLQHAETQTALRGVVAGLTLSAAEWQSLAKQLTGRAAKSGKVAREAVETYLSDRLLLNERVESVKRSFG